MSPTRVHLRPVRLADKEAVATIALGAFEGRDYVPASFDAWVNDSRAIFQAAELEGQVVGVHRLRPLHRGVVWYEGLRVDSRYRRRGIARAMTRAAIARARKDGFTEMRLGTALPEIHRFVKSEGFEQRLEVKGWLASAVQGHSTSLLPDPRHAHSLETTTRSNPSFAVYSGMNPTPEGAADLDGAELSRLASAGRLRVGHNARALAGLHPWPARMLATFVMGSGSACRELLLSLRSEADSKGLDGVALFAPLDHPAVAEMESAGYNWRNDPYSFTIYALCL